MLSAKTKKEEETKRNSGKEFESVPDAPTIYNVTMTLADTEYSQALPANLRKFLVQTRDGAVFRLAFATGKVAGPTEPYLTVRSPYNEDLILVESPLTLYFGCAEAGKVVEIVCWG